MLRSSRSQLMFISVRQEPSSEIALSRPTRSRDRHNRLNRDGGRRDGGSVLRVTGTEAAAAVKANEPLIRNQLVALFTQQTNEAMSTVEGKEKLRQEALKQTQQVLSDETGKPVVEDLLFNNLIIQ